MGSFAKIFAVVNLVLAVVFLGAASALLGKVDEVQKNFDAHVKEAAQTETALKRQVNDEKDQRQKAEAQMGTDAKARAAAEASLERLGNENASLMGNLNTMKDEITKLSASAEQTRKDLDTERARNDKLNRDLETARRETLAAKQQQRNLDTSLGAANDKITSLNDQVAALEMARADQAKVIDEKNNLLALVNSIYGKEWMNGIAQTPITSAVSSVDNELNIVLIRVGRSDGVEPGHRFTVSRGKEYVGRLVIDKVGDNWASGHMMKDVSKDEPAAGDEVNSHL